MYQIGQNILMFKAKYRTKRKLQIFKNQIYGLERHKYFLWWQDYEKERRYRTGLLAQYILPTPFSFSDLPHIRKFSKKGTIKLILFMFPYVVLQKCYKVYLGSYTKCTNGLSKLWGHIQWMWCIYAFIYIPYNIIQSIVQLMKSISKWPNKSYPNIMGRLWNNLKQKA